MSRKPRHINDRLIDARMWMTVVFTGLVIAVAALLSIDMFLPGGLILGTADPEHGTHRRLYRVGHD